MRKSGPADKARAAFFIGNRNFLHFNATKKTLVLVTLLLDVVHRHVT